MIEIIKITRNYLKSIPVEYKNLAKFELTSNMLSLEIVKESKRIGLFYSTDNEISTINLIETLFKQNKEIYLPRVNDKELIFSHIKNLNDLEKGTFNIMEPSKSNPTINPLTLDVLIVPCLLLDKNGNRIGKGGGYYDRLLEKYPSIPTVAIAYDKQIFNTINTQPHDQKVHYVISEKRIIKTQKKTISSKILNGAKVAEEITQKLKSKITSLKLKPKVSVILVGSNPASVLYVNKKKSECINNGINLDIIQLSECITTQTLLSKIQKLNNTKPINGILVQLPLPNHIDTALILNTIDPFKDIDCLTEISRSRIGTSQEIFHSPTAQGIIKLLSHYNISMDNKNIALIGYGFLVGQPLQKILKSKNVNFSLCTKQTSNITYILQNSDIIITATGQPHLITKEKIKDDAIIIDAGSSELNGKIVGDAHFNDIIDKVSYITPTPGGIGPMTIAILLENMIKAYLIQNQHFDHYL